MVLGHFFRSGWVWLFLVALLIPSGIAPAAPYPDTSCLDESPLILHELDRVGLNGSSIPLGEWRLPVSAASPEKLTHAIASLRLEQNPDTGNWWIHLDVSFPDPLPYGIPFTFQRSEFSWISANGPGSAFLDWSDNCGGPGRSIFPGQSFRSSVELKNSADWREIQKTVFRLWGSRN